MITGISYATTVSNRYQPTAGVVVEELDDGLCLFRESDSELLVLNHTAADVWRLADSSSDIGQIAAQLAERYDRPAAEIAPDVSRVLDELSAKGYLEPAAS